MTQVQVVTYGSLPKPYKVAVLRQVAKLCAAQAQAWSKPKRAWREVVVHLVRDAQSAEVNRAILGHEGATDVITQAYDALPGEEPGLVGELFVNLDQALRVSAQLGRTTPEEEAALYIAHGCDHLTGADDATPEMRRAMRRRDLRWMRRALEGARAGRVC